jgi:type I restriction-modification system DNA methylase subunit
MLIKGQIKDILGDVYQYFCTFASSEGRKGGQFCTSMRGSDFSRDAAPTKAAF